MVGENVWAAGRLGTGMARLGRLAAAFALMAAAAIGPGQTAFAGPTSPGELYSFGFNLQGQLGTETGLGTNNANPIPGLVTLPGASGPVTQAAAGGTLSLALTSTGQLYAFGGNSSGQLGNTINAEQPTPNPTPAPVTLPGASGPPSQVSAGAAHSLVVTSTGQLYAFGSNDHGQLGNEVHINTFAANPTPTPVSLPGATGPVAQAAAGWEDSFALTTTGQLYGFGENSHGQLGSGTGKEERQPLPTIVSLPTGSGEVRQVAAGVSHTLVLTSTGQVYAFGQNTFGQLGRAGTETASPTPALVSLPGATGPAVQIAAGLRHSLALTSTGQLYAFGANEFGQLGKAENSGTETPNFTPTLVELPNTDGPVTQIVAGLDHSLAMTASGQVYGWGENTFGQIGLGAHEGTGAPNPEPFPIPLPAGVGHYPGSVTFEFVAPGLAFHTLGVLSELSLSPGTFPAGRVGVPYSGQARVFGGVAPYAFSASALPLGLSIDAATGLVSGTPTAAGNFAGTVTVTDRHGIVASTPALIAIAPRVISCRCMLLRPRISGAHQSHRRWREGRRLARISRRLPVGTIFSFNLNERAAVSFRFTQSASGRRVGRKCVAPTKGNRHRRACRRTMTAGKLAFAGRAGRNRVAFQGRTSRAKKLKPGRYTLVITATDRAGRRSAPASLSFTIVR